MPSTSTAALAVFHHVGSSIIVIDLESGEVIFENTVAIESFGKLKNLQELISDEDRAILASLLGTSESHKPIQMRCLSKELSMHDLTISIDKIELSEMKDKQTAVLTFHATHKIFHNILRSHKVLENTETRFSLVNISKLSKPKLLLQSNSAAKAGITLERYFYDIDTSKTIQSLVEGNEKSVVLTREQTVSFPSQRTSQPKSSPEGRSSRHSLPDISEVDQINAIKSTYTSEITISRVEDPVTGAPCVLIRENDISELKRKEKQLQIELVRRKATSDFISNLSHEIRTPLNGIHGMLQYLSETKLTYDQKSSMSIATSSTIALTNLLTDVLDFSKIEAGKLSVRPAPILIRELISLLEEICHLFGTAVSSKGLCMYVEYPLEFYFTGISSIGTTESSIFGREHERLPAYIITDIMRIRQVLINLISNAIKYTSTGYVCARLVVLAPNHDAGYPIRFEIEDTGEGIDTTNINSVFARFNRVAGDKSEVDAPTRPEGTGIGLAIGKQISKLLGGDLLLQSKLGFGSKFTLCLPRMMNDSSKETRTRDKKQRISSAPNVGLFSELFAKEKTQRDSKVTISPQELRGIVQKVAIQVISPQARLLFTPRMESFFQTLNIRSYKSYESPERTSKVATRGKEAEDEFEIIYILDIVSTVASPISDNLSYSSRKLDATEYEWIDKVKEKINDLYQSVLQVYNMPQPLQLLSEKNPIDRSKHPANQGKLILVIPLSCAGLIRHVVPDISWFTSWLSSPLIPSDLISLLCGNYNNEQYQDVQSPRVMKREIEEKPEITAYHVLVAEDNRTNRMVFEKLLRQVRNDIDISFAKNGSEAVQLFKASFDRTPFDLCFMDIEMPKMNGMDASKAIRSLEMKSNSSRCLPIIALTANDTVTKRDTYIKVGMNDVLGKPIKKPLLEDFLKKFLPL